MVNSDIRINETKKGSGLYIGLVVVAYERGGCVLEGFCSRDLVCKYVNLRF